MGGSAETTTSSSGSSPASEVMQGPVQETTPRGSNHIPEKQLPTLLVAGISISFVFLFILVIVGVSYVQKKSNGGSAEINSVPSGEPGVSLKKISTDEDQCEWPFERAL
ncbi:uncharacterized protein M6G45_004422 isoform 2-T6 [Spheniscus humboldti]